MLEKNNLLSEIFAANREDLVKREALEANILRQGLEQGEMVLLANPKHANVVPTVIGQPASVKVNANIGTSPFINDLDMELAKADAAVDAGAHTLMDLSTSGDLDQIRQRILNEADVPLGTVPIYAVAQKYIDARESPGKISANELWEEIEKQAIQGVDFMTVHCGVTRRSARMARDSGRVMGVVSRGGSLLVRWMEENKAENPLCADFDRLLKIVSKYNVTLSLGDGMRPGACVDAGDRPQWEEVVVLADLAVKAREYGVQVMIEGPGHVPLSEVPAQIRGIKRLCANAPLYVLGPLTTDIAPGYDHISGAIGGAVAAMHGADFLCYLTPAEHLTLPDVRDVREGVIASRVAAHSAGVASHRTLDVQRNNAMSVARRELDWEKMTALALDPKQVAARRKDFSGKKECAMCGEFCAVKLLTGDGLSPSGGNE
ncbi:MAG: phosphomethylpyrimidine synthase ThiC [Thermodesulfobacteriota bacterium]